MSAEAAHVMQNVRTPETPSQIVDYILLSALKFNASDVHLSVSQHENASEPFSLRFRINGRLQVVKSDFLKSKYREVVARLKVLASMDSTDNRSAQDGQFVVHGPSGEVAVRMSTIPSGAHEDVVLRIQARAADSYSLDRLLMTKQMSAVFQNIIHQRSGLIVLNGPAGSGKTTTIYSVLATLASPRKKIVTAEDPVEMRLPFVNHFQVTQRLDFAFLCRAFMRQDADVIFIGEVRDTDSAQAAVQLAQTGHLVLTTLHTRDAIGVIPRLEAFDVHPNFIASTLIASLSQRLIERLCKECKVAYDPDPVLLSYADTIQRAPNNVTYYRAGRGCERCTGGVADRIPVFELFVVDPELSDMISRDVPKLDIRKRALEKGMRLLEQEILLRVYAGHIDISTVRGYISHIEYSVPSTQDLTRQEAP
jgi:type II secretory ATPase GspE/PulE/Tfp pilus assembly ATPase PilB-like protein